MSLRLVGDPVPAPELQRWHRAISHLDEALDALRGEPPCTALEGARLAILAARFHALRRANDLTPQ